MSFGSFPTEILDAFGNSNLGISSPLKKTLENTCRIVHGLVAAIVPDGRFSVAATSVHQEGPQGVEALFGAIRFEGCNTRREDSVCRHNTQGRLTVLDCSKDPRTDKSLFVVKGGLRTYIGCKIRALSDFHICVLHTTVLSSTDAEKVYHQLSIVRQMLEHSVQITLQHRMADRELEVLKDVFANLPGTIAFECKFDEKSCKEKVVWVTGSTEAVLGFSNSECQESASLHDFIAPESIDKWKETTQKCLKGAQTLPVELEFKMIHKDGSTVFVRRDKLSRKTPRGLLLVILHDVTSEVQLREMTKMRDVEKARTANAKKMSAYLAHEVRNQLYPQQLTLEEMRSELDESGSSAASFRHWVPKIDMILSANGTVSQILSSTLQLARWEAGEFPVTHEFFPLTWLHQGIELFTKAKGGSITIVGKLPPSLYVNADKHILKQAAQNLISNADKFRDGSPFTATFAFKRTSEKVGILELVIKDEGRGMSKDDLSKVMRPFSQIRKGDAVSGTGLGLVLAKEMIETGHSGRLTLFSAGLGKGTTATIRVTVPWMDQAMKVDKTEEQLHYVKYDKNADVDVLIVDDVKLNRLVTANASKKLGLTFEVACDGKEACEKMASKKYGVVLMDNEMPVMNGVEATEQSRRDGYGNGLIVMVSGNEFDTVAKENIRKRGMSAFISKMGKPSARDLLRRYQLEKTSQTR